MPSRRLLAPLVLAPFAVATVLAAPAGAAPAAPQFAVSVAPASSADLTTADAAAARQSAGIVRQNGTVKWNRDRISGPRAGRTSTRCTATNASFIVNNTSGARQTVTVRGNAFATVPAGGRAFICGFSSAPFSATFGIKGRADKLQARFT